MLTYFVTVPVFLNFFVDMFSEKKFICQIIYYILTLFFWYSSQ